MAPGAVHRLVDVGRRGAEHADQRQHEADDDLARADRPQPELMREEQSDAEHGDRRAEHEAGVHAVAKEDAGEDGVGDQQQREEGGHQPRGDVPLGEIDAVEIEAELGGADDQGGDSPSRLSRSDWPWILASSIIAEAAMTKR